MGKRAQLTLKPGEDQVEPDPEDEQEPEEPEEQPTKPEEDPGSEVMKWLTNIDAKIDRRFDDMDRRIKGRRSHKPAEPPENPPEPVKPPEVEEPPEPESPPEVEDPPAARSRRRTIRLW